MELPCQNQCGRMSHAGFEPQGMGGERWPCSSQPLGRVLWRGSSSAEVLALSAGDGTSAAPLLGICWIFSAGFDAGPELW